MSEYSYRKPSLSHYFKEMGSFGDLSLATAAGIQKLSPVLPEATPTTTMNLFPEQSGFVSPLSKEAVPKMADSRANQQMTIFYDEKLIVFDHLPAEKAKEVMLLATNGSSQLTHKSSSTVLPNFSNNENSQRPSLPVVSDLPIARRASLHRFLEKRKDRITAKPYQSDSPKPATESKPWLGLTAQSPKSFQC